MAKEKNRFTFTIPADYTNSSYPLQYYFLIRSGSENVWSFPGLGKLRNQPYFTVRSRSASAVNRPDRT